MNAVRAPEAVNDERMTTYRVAENLQIESCPQDDVTSYPSAIPARAGSLRIAALCY
jgi:hypothetical protein